MAKDNIILYALGIGAVGIGAYSVIKNNELGETISSALQSLQSGGSVIFSGQGTDSSSVLSSLLSNIKESGSTVINLVTDAVDTAKDTVTDAVSGMSEIDLFSGLTSGISDTTTSWGDSLREGLASLGKNLGAGLGEGAVGILNGWSWVWANVGGKISGYDAGELGEYSFINMIKETSSDLSTSWSAYKEAKANADNSANVGAGVVGTSVSSKSSSKTSVSSLLNLSSDINPQTGAVYGSALDKLLNPSQMSFVTI